MTCVHCEELREEIRFLKREIAVEDSEELIDRLRLYHHLQPAEARILAALYCAKGRVLSVYQLDELCPLISATEDRDIKHVNIRICRLRKKLGAEAIQNVWGRGYCITDLGRLQVEEALEAQRRAA